MTRIIRPPTSNVDKLEGAVEHIFRVCGVLNDISVDRFVQKYAYLRRKKLPADYGHSTVIPRMKSKQILFQVGHHRYSLNPCYTKDQKGQMAFWVFLENMDGVDLETLQRPLGLATLAYIKNNRCYSIICCEGDGKKELSLAIQQEIAAERAAKRHHEAPPDERYFFVFSSREAANNAPFVPKAPTLFAVVEHDDAGQPVLTFLRPNVKAANEVTT